jgi:hypothetical protein
VGIKGTSEMQLILRARKRMEIFRIQKLVGHASDESTLEIDKKSKIKLVGKMYSSSDSMLAIIRRNHN